MEGNARRVAVFIGAGAMLAALVGFTVWATSTPGQNNRAGFTAEAAGTSDTDASTSSTPPSTTTTTATSTRSATPDTDETGTRSPEADTADEPQAAASMPAGYVAEHDPYLPPHAVVAPAPGAAQASRVYRPTNIVPSSAAPAAAQQGPGSAPASATSTPGSVSQRPSEPTPGSTNNEPTTATPQGEQTTTPSPGGSASQPAEATDPERSSAAEPTKSPHQGAGVQGADVIDQGSQPAEHLPAGDAGAGAAGQAEEAPATPQGQEAQATAAGAAPAADGSAAPGQADTAADSAPAAQPPRVPGKEDVAGYPSVKEGTSAREVIDRFTSRVTR